jgi:hypothetical protein
MRAALALVLCLLGSVPIRAAELPAAPATDEQFFTDTVLPVLEARCFACHSHDHEIKGGLALDSRSGWVRGGDQGPAIVPGAPEESLLIEAISHTNPELQMPPEGAIPAEELAHLVDWARRGAPDPRVIEVSPEEAWKEKLAERATWWSLQPPRPNAPPSVADPAWQRDPVDRFIRAKLDAAGIEPTTPANADVLRRRLSFLLTGLPPSFHASIPSSASTEEVVDALLASPHFGEQFARHWMDVVRYTDTYGYEWDIAARGSSDYRDYLVRAFNDDIGFDQLVREQIAGDLLPEPRVDRVAGVNASLIGPMFFHLGEHRHGSSLDFNGIHQEMIDNKIDASSKTFLAMTVGCARCHDHKLDAISQKDYYALAGMFMTPRWTPRDVSLPSVNALSIADLERLRAEIQASLAVAWSREAVAFSGATIRERLQADPDGPKAASISASIDDVSHPLAKLLEAAAEPGADASVTVPKAWKTLAAEWLSARAMRQEANARFTALVDLTEPGLPAGWVAEGEGMAHGHVAAGTVRVALEGDALVAGVIPAGHHTYALSPRLPGILRLPPPESFPRKWVSVQLAGGEWAAKLVIPQNAILNEGSGGPAFFDAKAAPQWQAVSLTPLKNGVTRVLTEFATTDFNPNFPPRTGLATAGGVTLPAADDGVGKKSWFSITGIVAHDDPGAPLPDLDLFATLFDRDAPATEEATWDAVADWLRGAIDRFAAGKATAGDVRLLDWMLARKLLPNDTTALPEIGGVVARYRGVEATIRPPRTVNSMDERGMAPIDYRLNLRGDVDAEGEAVPHGFLEVFAASHGIGSPAGSGRLELANALASDRNPQTARVYVNRVWQWVFGTGLVSTSSDFGRLGDRPSHPELLDWLAIDFMRDGWSTKRLVRQLVLTETFRQGSHASAAALIADPDNRLLHHHPTRRLDAEAIRDSLLAVSGRLDPRLGGRPIRPHRFLEDPAKRLFAGPLDGEGRRSIYLEMSIMAPPPFLVGFNLPAPKIPTGKRDVTSVPAQALILMNDPFVVAMADHWAGRLLADGRSVPAERVAAMFREALGREPDSEELSLWVGAAGEFAPPNATPEALMADRSAWKGVAHALFNTKEFIHHR